MVYNTLMENGVTDQQQPSANWQFTPDDASDSPSPAPKREPHDSTVEWTASEFMAHHKSTSWYAALALAAVIVAGFIYILTKDEITAGVILFAAAVMGFVAGRKPRTLNYRVAQDGVHIDAKVYTYQDYKAFSIIDEGAINSIKLVPLKRFLPPISMYYAPQDEKKIVEALSDYLPYEDKDDDAFDRMVRKIRF